MSTEKNAVKERIEMLKQKIRRAAELYYDKDAPEISDFEYDAMFAELKKLLPHKLIIKAGRSFLCL